MRLEDAAQGALDRVNDVAGYAGLSVRRRVSVRRPGRDRAAGGGTRRGALPALGLPIAWVGPSFRSAASALGNVARAAALGHRADGRRGQRCASVGDDCGPRAARHGPPGPRRQDRRRRRAARSRRLPGRRRTRRPGWNTTRRTRRRATRRTTTGRHRARSRRPAHDTPAHHDAPAHRSPSRERQSDGPTGEDNLVSRDSTRETAENGDVIVTHHDREVRSADRVGTDGLSTTVPSSSIARPWRPPTATAPWTARRPRSRRWWTRMRTPMESKSTTTRWGPASLSTSIAAERSLQPE